jgi:transcriptional regulator with XRE-family HTH domain
MESVGCSSTFLAYIDLFLRRPIFASMSLMPQQCRAARGLLDWTQEELAERAGVSRSTVRGFENGQHELHRGSAAVIRGALEAAGVILIDADDKAGAGVRLRGSCIRSPDHQPAGTG